MRFPRSCISMSPPWYERPMSPWVPVAVVPEGTPLVIVRASSSAISNMSSRWFCRFRYSLRPGGASRPYAFWIASGALKGSPGL